MKKIVALVVSAVVLITGVVITCFALQGKPSAAEAASRMTVEINPKVEFFLDTDNKVVSVSGLNDEGKLLVSGEAFIGKTAEDAAQLVVQLATETGYLVKGSVTASDNQITVSVTSDSENISKLADSVKNQIQSYADRIGLTAKVEQGKALTLEEMRKIAAACTTYTQEELAAMDMKQLCAAISVSRIETAELLSVELEEAYYQAKAYRFAAAENEKIKELIGQAGDAYAALLASYDKALASFEDAINAIEKARYDNLVDPDSEYQKALAELAARKQEVLEARKELAAAENDVAKAAAQLVLTGKEATYTVAQGALESCGTVANKVLDVAVAMLNSTQQALVELRAELPAEIQSILTDKAQEIDAAANAAKDSFFETFEAAHADDIQAIKDAVAARKQALKDMVAA